MPKPNKPYPGFPLTPHASGNWCKKIRGKIWYFGRDSEKALRQYLAEVDDIRAGLDPRKQKSVEGLTIEDICDEFLEYKRSQVLKGELSKRTLENYVFACDKLIEFFSPNCLAASLGPRDWTQYHQSLPSQAPSSRQRLVTTTRSIFRYAAEGELIPYPMKFGPRFKGPSRQAKRIHETRKRAERGELCFTAEEIRNLLDHSGDQWRGMILLAINCAFGNADLSRLQWTSVDLARGFVSYGREKTGTDRRCPLWKETQEALSVLREGDLGGLVFRTKSGKVYGQTAISGPFGAKLRRLGIKREGLNFYSLRRTFETQAAKTDKQVAVDFIMGHLENSMAEVYRQHIEDRKLLEVTDYVRSWLFRAN